MKIFTGYFYCHSIETKGAYIVKIDRDLIVLMFKQMLHVIFAARRDRE